jgi:DNA-binding MarR family transcriptional regulator
MAPRQKLTSSELKTATVALAVIELFRELRDTMPLQYVRTFFLVAQQEGRSVTDYAKTAGVSKTVMSRHLLDIGPTNRDMGDGFQLVVSNPDPSDSRNKLYYLSEKGRTLLRRVQRLID